MKQKPHRRIPKQTPYYKTPAYTKASCTYFFFHHLSHLGEGFLKLYIGICPHGSSCALLSVVSLPDNNAVTLLNLPKMNHSAAKPYTAHILILTVLKFAIITMQS
jgi:hypothetical protein